VLLLSKTGKQQSENLIARTVILTFRLVC